MSDDEEIRRIANEARADFEAGTIPEAQLVQLYGDYCPAVDANMFVAAARVLFPAGNCGLASLYLQFQLQGGEVAYGTYARKGHTFWHMGSLIVDITSDQYGGPKVYVGPLVEPWSLQAPDSAYAFKHHR
ncbi:MAG TPA: hypothetical protein VIQ80_00890 [Candidatus Saccharimonadales bacterium]